MTCRRCHGTGLVPRDELAPDGKRLELVYRCDCPQGERCQAFKLTPAEYPEPPPSLVQVADARAHIAEWAEAGRRQTARRATSVPAQGPPGLPMAPGPLQLPPGSPGP
jgi:hypothetical protein